MQYDWSQDALVAVHPVLALVQNSQYTVDCLLSPVPAVSTHWELGMALNGNLGHTVSPGVQGLASIVQCWNHWWKPLPERKQESHKSPSINVKEFYCGLHIHFRDLSIFPWCLNFFWGLSQSLLFAVFWFRPTMAIIKGFILLLTKLLLLNVIILWWNMVILCKVKKVNF
jgi:hypothetical protein